MRTRKQFFDTIINIFKPKLQVMNEKDKQSSVTIMVEDTTRVALANTTTTTSGRISKKLNQHTKVVPLLPQPYHNNQKRTTDLHDHDSAPSQYLLHFLGETLASLPYKYEEEPLYLIYSIDRMLTIHGTNTIDHGNTLLNSNRKNNADFQEDLENVYSCVYGLIVLYELRKHLKKIYHVTATRIKSFDHGTYTKTH